MTPTYIIVHVYLPVLLIKRLHIAFSLLIKLRIKQFLDVLLETYLIIFWPKIILLSCFHFKPTCSLTTMIISICRVPGGTLINGGWYGYVPPHIPLFRPFFCSRDSPFQAIFSSRNPYIFKEFFKLNLLQALKIISSMSTLGQKCVPKGE